MKKIIQATVVFSATIISLTACSGKTEVPKALTGATSIGGVSSTATPIVKETSQSQAPSSAAPSSPVTANENISTPIASASNQTTKETKPEASNATTSSASNYYVVANGDTLSSISLSQGVTIEELINCNGINPNFITVGEKLILKCSPKDYKTANNSATANGASAPASTQQTTKQENSTVQQPSSSSKATVPTATSNGPVQTNQNNSNSGSSNSSGVLWSDVIMGGLSDYTHVPCGGLWSYGPAGFYAREASCAGSGRYFALVPGQKVQLGAKVCTYVGSQDLNYNRNTTKDLRWMGNTIVQTCIDTVGNVREFNFNCG